MIEDHRSIPEIVIQPDLYRPDLTLFNFGDFYFDGKNPGAPFDLSFYRLTQVPWVVSVIARAMAEKIRASGVMPDVICGLYPGGTRLSGETASMLKIPRIKFHPRSLSTNLPKHEETLPEQGSCLVVDDQMTHGKGVLRAGLTLQGFSLTVVAVMSVVSYDIPSIRVKLAGRGIEDLSLTTIKKVVEDPAFADRFSPDQVAQATRWVSSLR